MHSRPFRSLSAVAVASALLLGLAPVAGAAGSKDGDATKLFDQAMDDYLNAEFAKAEKKLKDAVKKCGASDCTPAVLGKIHVALGTVYGIGLSKTAEAKDEFTAALKADPKAALDPALSNPDLVKIFEEAKKAAGGSSAAAGTGGSTVAAGTGGSPATGPKQPKEPKGDSDVGTHKAPTESVVNTPLPLYFEPSEEIALSKVTLRYKPFGEKVYKSVELTKMGNGFGGEIPCKDVSTTGDVKYFFALTDENGDAAGTLGSTKQPFKTTIKNEIEGDAPTLPGKKPPDQCKEKTDCPEGLPGCPEKAVKRGDKGWGASCEQTTECQAGLVCLNGTCEEGKDDDPGAHPKSKTKRFMLGVWGQFDIMNIASKTDVCSPAKAGEASNYICFLAGKKTQFDGTIANVPGTNGIDGGLKFLPDARILASFDFMVPKIPLSIGARFGVAIGGSPTPDNPMITTDKNGNKFLPISHQPAAHSFFPLHYELRAAWHFGGSMLDAMAFRPYAFVAFGGGQVNGAVPVQVCDTTAGAMGDNGAKCKGGTSVKTTVDAYQITGLNFIGFGGGTTFGITPNFGVGAELKFMLMVPTFGFVFAPVIGPVFAF